MADIPQLKGNKQNIEFIARSLNKGMLSHAYIINGDQASEKEAFANYIAAALLCDNVNNKDEDPNQASFGAMFGIADNKPKVFAPCGHCPSCIKAASGNHPDIIHVYHDKATVLKVDEVREQVVNDIAIKPYYGPYKIYIINDAHLMNENGQNALLKTIEEPETYGIILLLTDNADGFLQTIRSRCIRINMDPLTREEIASNLIDEDGQQVLDVFQKLQQMNALQINKIAKEFESLDKKQVIDIARYFFRDLLVLKSTGEENRMTFASQLSVYGKMAEKTSFEGINRIILAVQEAEARINTSVKAEAVYEVMMLAIRRELKN